MLYTVVVDNVVTVHQDNNLISARMIVKEYREQIERGYGRAGPSIAIIDQCGDPIYEWRSASELVTWNCEITDTFGGEANYSWVKRATVNLPERASQATIIRAAKAALGMTGVRGRTMDFGDCFEWRPYGILNVMFVTANY